MNIISLACAALLLSASASIARGAPDEAIQTVSVAGVRDPDLKTYKAFMAGMDAFDSHRALAPRADLRFLLTARNAGVKLDGLTMHISADDLDVPVVVSADGGFVMPRNREAVEKDAEVILNKKKGQLRWRPDVHSPNVPVDARRLGDLRLECEVLWAVSKLEMPSFQRVFINAFDGPCNTKAVHVNYVAPKQLSAVVLEAGNRREKLDAEWIENNGQMYVPPLHDRSWPDDTLVKFEFAQ